MPTPLHTNPSPRTPLTLTEAKKMHDAKVNNENNDITRAALIKMIRDKARVILSSIKGIIVLERNGVATEAHHLIITSYEVVDNKFNVRVKSYGPPIADLYITISYDQLESYYDLKELCPNIDYRRLLHAKLIEFVKTLTKEELKKSKNAPVDILCVTENYIKYHIPFFGNYILLNPEYKPRIKIL